MKNFVFGCIATVLIVAAIAGAFYFGQKTVKTSVDTKATLVTKAALEETKEAVVGNDTDEHGCKPSAGYSWCQAKNKCLRIWEEKCTVEDDALLIKEALFKKNGWKESDGITVKVTTDDGEFASGGVTAQDGGGYFFAAKVNGVWKIVADGNGTIACLALKDYPNFPKTLIPECWDQATGKNIER